MTQQNIIHHHSHSITLSGLPGLLVFQANHYNSLTGILGRFPKNHHHLFGDYTIPPSYVWKLFHENWLFEKNCVF